MKNSIKMVFTILCLALVFQGCGAKRMVKKASQFEEQGLYTEAANYYFKALDKNHKNVKALIGLRKNGELAFKDLIDEFESQHHQKNYKESVYSFLTLSNYLSSAKQYGILFKIPAASTFHFKKDKRIYLGKVYDEITYLLDKDQFTKAAIQLEEVEKFDANYKDIQDLKLYAQFEPLYREAKEAYRTGKYRLAYQQYTSLGNYRDSENQKDKAQKEASLTILVLPFYNYSNEYNVQFDIEDKVVSSIIGQQNPFIKIIENRDNISPLDRDTYHANKTGKYPNYKNKRKSLKAKAVLIGEIIHYHKSSDRVKAEEVKGYSYSWTDSTIKEDKSTRKKIFKKVIYNEHQGSSKVEVHFSYRLISTETGETLLADVIELGERDHIHYASYDGDPLTLVPGNWKKIKKEDDSDYILDNEEDIKELRLLFEGRKKLMSIPELKLGAINRVADETAFGITNFNPEL